MLAKTGDINLRPGQTDEMFIDQTTLDVYWGRLISYETLLTCFFTIIYLILRYESAMKKVDRIVKGAACSFAMISCLLMTNGAGASLNPALGFAQSIYMIGLGREKRSLVGDREAKFIWVYMIFPYLGAFLAAFFYRMHDYIEKNEYNQNQPIQFVGLLRQSESAPLLTASRSDRGQADRSQVWSQLHPSNLADSRNGSIDSMAIANKLNQPVVPQIPVNPSEFM
jgi:hypothetical protein